LERQSNISGKASNPNLIPDSGFLIPDSVFLIANWHPPKTEEL